MGHYFPSINLTRITKCRCGEYEHNPTSGNIYPSPTTPPVKDPKCIGWDIDGKYCQKVTRGFTCWNDCPKHGSGPAKEQKHHDLEETPRKAGFTAQGTPSTKAFEETPTVNEVNHKWEPPMTENTQPIPMNQPLSVEHSTSRDTKKCTCARSWDNKTRPPGKAVKHHPDCHGDGAKKDNPREQIKRGEIHTLDEVFGPQDSLDEILDKHYWDLVYDDKKKAKSALQDWHITQVREKLGEIRKELRDPRNTVITGGSPVAPIILVDKIFLRALERLDRGE